MYGVLSMHDIMTMYGILYIMYDIMTMYGILYMYNIMTMYGILFMHGGWIFHDDTILCYIYISLTFSNLKSNCQN